MSRVRRVGRPKPYTARGISRISCTRCGAPSKYQWSACAIDNRYVALCPDCDILLNAMALRFMRIPDRQTLMARYRRRVRHA